MFNQPLDALPPSVAQQDPTFQHTHDPLGLPAEELEELELSCVDLEALGLWDCSDCCDSLCHQYEPVRPAPLRYGHVTVRGCCHSHEALGHLDPPKDDFIQRIFR